MIPEAQLKELEKVVRECYPETCVRLQPQPDTNAWLKEPVFNVEGDNEIASFYADMFNRRVGNLPFKYLGIHVTFSALKNSV